MVGQGSPRIARPARKWRKRPTAADGSGNPWFLFTGADSAFAAVSSSPGLASVGARWRTNLTRYEPQP